MFNRTQWLTVAALFIIGTVIHSALNSTQLNEGHLAASVGAMSVPFIISLIGGAIGRKWGEQATTNGIIIGFVIIFALLTKEHWAG